jgi:peptidoglycan pentaglycine glycine transferase (the first glycine)
MSEISLIQWNDFIRSHSGAHLLQTGAWGELKSRFQWEAFRVVSKDVGVQMLVRGLPSGFSIAYIPRGPVGKEWNQIWWEIYSICKKKHAIFLKIEPDVWDSDFDRIKRWLPDNALPAKPFQPPRTILVDLKPSLEEILNRMKQKTRYNIRLAEKKGIEIRFSNDIVEFHKLMTVTGKRDGFGVHNLAYFQSAYDLFQPSNSCKLLLAYFQNQPIAGLMVFKQGNRAWYLFGASNELERNRMPTYLLQWSAMKWAKEEGCLMYDLWGIPDAVEEILEANFEKLNTGLWGVYRFKRGFGGEVRRIASSFDCVFNPVLYRIYQLYSRLRSSRELG